MVYFDYRGSGMAEPSLTCEELNAAGVAAQAVDRRAIPAASFVVELMNQCRDRLIASGVDLTAYTTSEIAADVNDVRAALGYPAIHIVGASYGTALGLAVARDFPQIVRTNNLFSVLPIQTRWYFEVEQSFDGALDALFRDCHADRDCRRDYPHLKQNFRQVVADLNANPAVVPLTDPYTGQVYGEYAVDGDTFVHIMYNVLYLHELLYAHPLVANVPDMITRAAAGQTDWLGPMLVLLSSDPTASAAYGMYFSVVCSYNPTEPQLREALKGNKKALPEIRAIMEQTTVDIYHVCATWPSRNADPRANVPAANNVRTLMISSEYDPITPPGYADIAAATLPNTTRVTIPGAGHVAIFPTDPGGACGLSIAMSQIANPAGAPDTSCVAQVPNVFAPLPPEFVGGPTP